MQQRNDEKIFDKFNAVHNLCPHRRVLDDERETVKINQSKLTANELSHEEFMQDKVKSNNTDKDFNLSILQMRKMVQEGRAEREDENLKRQRQNVRTISPYARVRVRELYRV